MKLTLHDVLTASAGEAGPGPRPRITDEVRSSWVRAMHDLVTSAGGEGRCRTGDFGTGAGRLRVKTVRRGRAVAAVWAAWPQDTVVAASVLLTGESAAADDAVAADLEALWPSISTFVADQDLDLAAAQHRPCLATFYCDARWYDNARVELAATALALAVLYGPEGSLKVRGEADGTPAAGPRSTPGVPPVKPKPRLEPWFVEPEHPLPFNFTRERLQLVMDMVTKKASVAMERLPGLHFRVYPPREYLARPHVLGGDAVFGRLKHTLWLVQWYDGRRDRLEFGEFLGFLDQLGAIENAYYAAANQTPPAAGGPRNATVWPAGRPAGGGAARQGEARPVKVGGTLRTRELVTDANIRRLLATVTLEEEPAPDDAPAPTAVG